MSTTTSENRPPLNLVMSDIEAFNLFEIDAGTMRHIADSQDGKYHQGELIFPELGGEYTPLWEVKETAPQSEGVNSLWGQRKKNNPNDMNSQEKRANLQAYIDHVASGAWERGIPLSQVAIHTR